MGVKAVQRDPMRLLVPQRLAREAIQCLERELCGKFFDVFSRSEQAYPATELEIDAIKSSYGFPSEPSVMLIGFFLPSDPNEALE